jgi:hypothetical protein
MPPWLATIVQERRKLKAGRQGLLVGYDGSLRVASFSQASTPSFWSSARICRKSALEDADDLVANLGRRESGPL